MGQLLHLTEIYGYEYFSFPYSGINQIPKRGLLLTWCAILHAPCQMALPDFRKPPNIKAQCEENDFHSRLGKQPLSKCIAQHAVFRVGIHKNINMII